MKQIFLHIKQDYIEYKERYNLYDFTDLPKYLLNKMNDYNYKITDIDALFVDEFQDVNDIQLEVFNRVESKKNFYIGDVKQSIYLFRGASPDVLERLSGFKRYNLTINYRSFQEIIDLATTVQERAMEQVIDFCGLIESYPSNIICIRGYGGEVYTINSAGKAYQTNEYLKKDGYKVFKKFMKKHPMVLCRTNKEVKRIKKLGYDKVSTIHQAKGLEYDNVVVTSFDIGPEDIQEINIAYVAMTRAKNGLLVSDYDIFYEFLQLHMPELETTILKSFL